ncbi:epoxide hydrolase family protein, partial [Sciscionella sediminilitoris]|uniref:epoxide hydrolase family protein n=1 Tax=Sciscionella sediminilitoris TaxID=1445613 RepID=UPI0004DEF38D
TEYDWREHEASLNSYPQFTTEIDGQRIHFLHVRSADPDAIALILTHGWPGSVVEFLDVIEPLSRKFHLVIPSMPGYGFSTPLSGSGWDLRRVSAAFAELMARLGYPRYGAQGGDWGSGISLELGRIDPEHVVGVHVNMLGTVAPEEPTAEEQERLEWNKRYFRELSGYRDIQRTRPRTLGYGLHDSPVGQLAWIAEKFHDWTDCADRPEDAVDRDRMLTNITLYWLTGTAGSSARLYYETGGGMRPPRELSVPLGVAVFGHDIVLPIRSVAERQLPTITRWSEFDRGGHFAALEQPAVLTEEILAFFGNLT